MFFHRNKVIKYQDLSRNSRKRKTKPVETSESDQSQLDEDENLTGKYI